MESKRGRAGGEGRASLSTAKHLLLQIVPGTSLALEDVGSRRAARARAKAKERTAPPGAGSAPDAKSNGKGSEGGAPSSGDKGKGKGAEPVAPSRRHEEPWKLDVTAVRATLRLGLLLSWIAFKMGKGGNGMQQ